VPDFFVIDQAGKPVPASLRQPTTLRHVSGDEVKLREETDRDDPAISVPKAGSLYHPHRGSVGNFAGSERPDDARVKPRRLGLSWDYASATRTLNRLLKSALAVSTKTPLRPPTATVQSPPE
jgi:hypothetical protein